MGELIARRRGSGPTQPRRSCASSATTGTSGSTLVAEEVAELRFRGRPVKDAWVARLDQPLAIRRPRVRLDVTSDWHDGREKLWP